MNRDSRFLDNKRYVSFTLGTTFVGALVFAVITACTGEQAKAKPNIVHKDAPHAGVVAKIGDEEITEEMLVGDDKMDFFELKKHEYDLKMERVKKLMVDKLIGAQAKAAGMSTEDFISKKIVGGEISVSDKDYRKFVEEKHIPESQINPQIKERIFQYLQTSKKQDLVDAYVAKLTKSHPVEVYFNKPKMNVVVDVGKAPIFGKEDASVTIVEFSDFQCPYCSRAAATVSELKKKYGSKIKLAFKHFPLPMHKDARPTAEASMCVAEQGADKFWKFHDAVFKNQDKLDASNIAKVAKESGADEKKYADCVAGKKYADYIQKDMEYGEKVGVKSTPTFFINGQILNGAVPIDQFSEIIDDELAEKAK
jgi:protein-disulfide isomerase